MAAPRPVPLAPLLLLLSVTTGLVDAASVLGLDKVFTANMTGNIVFLGFAAAGAPGFAAMAFAAAIATFLLGAFLAGRIGRALAGEPLRNWLLVSAIIEALLLGVAALVALWRGANAGHDLDYYAIIAATAVAMGFRNGTIRQLKVPDLTTTVLTLTLTGLAADSALAGGSNTNWTRRVGAVVAIFLGAALGALMLLHWGLFAPLALAALLVLAGTLIVARHPAAAAPLA
ncbi:MAG: DUF1275 domain-containing protein [Sphingomonas sp.]|uniref:YoaK family protein n=1 Tax=Sphingomonas sp. TaxID=28214 RepID=UPI001B0CA7B1|nr:YoaK family protein [Sphingomonas sp.]MBO9621246.1 DUF1275 domain-containing protein [Sphingomonas sp.]